MNGREQTRNGVPFRKQKARNWDHLKNTPDDVVIDNFDFAVRLSASMVAQVTPEEIRHQLRRFYKVYWRNRIQKPHNHR